MSTTRPLRLLAYTDSGSVGGAELALGYLLGALGGKIEVGVLATDLAVAEKIASHRRGAVPISIKSPRGSRDLGAFLEHRAAIRAFAPDVLHCNQAWPWACAYGELVGVLDRGVCVLAVDHLPVSGAIPRTRRLGRRLLARRLDKHVSVGERSARRVEEMVGLPSNTIGSVPNGVPPISRPGPRSRVDDEPDGRRALVIGSVGRLTDQKGYDLLLRALPGLSPARLVLVGDGPRRSALEALATELGVAERLQITGWVDDAPARLGGFDIFALPSRWEGMPLGILEAMHAGLPVVACDVGSVSEVVDDGQTGYVVQVEDVGALQARLRELLEDGALRERMGERARRLAKTRFTDALMARRYEAIYSSMVGWWQPEDVLAISG